MTAPGNIVGVLVASAHSPNSLAHKTTDGTTPACGAVTTAQWRPLSPWQQRTMRHDVCHAAACWPTAPTWMPAKVTNAANSVTVTVAGLLNRRRTYSTHQPRHRATNRRPADNGQVVA